MLWGKTCFFSRLPWELELRAGHLIYVTPSTGIVKLFLTLVRFSLLLG